MYPALKHSHLLFVAISILLFEYRFILKMMKKTTGKTLKIVPHVNDTLLLATGISLAYIAQINPIHQIWLGSKIVALLFYIGFGMMALKSKGNKSIMGYILATACFVFILFTAITKNPLFINL